MKKEFWVFARRRKISLWTGLVVIFGVCFTCFYVFPIYWNVLTSIKPPGEIVTMIPELIPRKVYFKRYAEIFLHTHFGQNIRNSAIVASVSTMLCLLISISAGYAIARIKIRGRRVMLMSILFLSMLPGMAIISALYLLFKSAHLINTHLCLIITYSAFWVPFSVWILTNFFMTIPTALEDAALVDGCSPLQALEKIIIPLAIPAVFTVTILIFIFTWNEFLFAFTFTTTHKVITAPVGIFLFQGQHQIPWGEMSTASSVVSIPVVILVVVLQRYIVEGLTSGAVKG